MSKMPEGQLCQAKDEFGIVPYEWNGQMTETWGKVRGESACGHPASVMWTEGAMAAIHGAYAWWCECCALDVQIRHAEERAKELESLRAKRLTA
jgi:hypothetical protein